jgi:hypothetical protein
MAVRIDEPRQQQLRAVAEDAGPRIFCRQRGKRPDRDDEAVGDRDRPVAVIA